MAKIKTLLMAFSCMLGIGCAPIVCLADTYGYIVGALNTSAYQYDNNSSTDLPFGIELLSQEGQYLHYYFFLDVGGLTLKASIDIKDANQYEVPYRVVSMKSQNATYYNGVLGQPVGTIQTITTYNSTSGALDYIRHPGVLLDMAGGRPWQEYYEYYGIPVDNVYNQPWENSLWNHLEVYTDDINPNQLYAPALDSLFINVQKIYVFGDLYSSGGSYSGIHNVHQKQGNRLNNYMYTNRVYQDGAVVFEYADGSRKMLMVKFGDYYKTNQSGYTTMSYNQIDFSYDAAGNGHNAGDGAPFEYEVIAFDPEVYPNGHMYGPYLADQIEIIGSAEEFDCMIDNDPDLYLSESANVSPSNYRIKATNSGCVTEYLRSSKDLWTALNVSPNLRRQYYLFIHPYSCDGVFNVYVKYR